MSGKLAVSSILPDKLFDQWKDWIERVRMELIELRIMLLRFKELQHATEPYRDQEECHWNLADFMIKGYTAFVCVGVRRLAEVPPELVRLRQKQQDAIEKGKTPPSLPDPNDKPIKPERDILSLAALLWEFQKAVSIDNSLITREKQRHRYREAMPAFPDRAERVADRVHDALAGAGVDVLQADTIKYDILCVEAIAVELTILANKRFAHLSRDENLIPRSVTYGEIEEAIKKLEAMFTRYNLGMFGNDPQHPFEDYSISEELEIIWPRIDDRPSVIETMFHSIDL